MFRRRPLPTGANAPGSTWDYTTALRRADQRAARKAALAGEPDLDYYPARSTTASIDQIIGECTQAVTSIFQRMDRTLDDPRRQRARLLVGIEHTQQELTACLRDLANEGSSTNPELGRMLLAQRTGLSQSLLKQRQELTAVNHEIESCRRNSLWSALSVRSHHLTRIKYQGSVIRQHHPDRGRLDGWLAGLGEKEIDLALLGLANASWRQLLGEGDGRFVDLKQISP